MKKFLLVAALAFTSAAVAVQQAAAQATAQFVFTPTSNVTNLAPGSTLTFSINLNVTGLTGNAGDPGVQNLDGLSFYIQHNGTGASPFSITGRDNTGSLFTELQSTNAQVFANPASLLNPTNDRDLGALVDPNFAPLGDGNYFIANITLTVGAVSSPANYTIRSTSDGSSIINDTNGDTMNVQQGSFVVTVVPEPSTYALLAVGAIAAGASAYRRRRAAKV